MIDILAISHACSLAINRLPYQRLWSKGWNIELVVPEKLKFPSGDRVTDPRGDSDPPMHSLSLTHDDPRRYRYSGLISLLDEKRPRIVFLDNDPVSLLSLQIGWWAKKNGSLLLCQSCENLSRRIIPSFRRNGWYGLISATVLNLVSWMGRSGVNYVFVISEDGRRVFQELGYSDKIGKIPLGFDPALFKPDMLSRNTIRSELKLNKVTVAYFGRLTKEKGVHVLLLALEQIKGLEWQLLLDTFGNSPSAYQVQLQKMIDEMEIADRTVSFDASHAEMPDYMNAADIVVVPSISTPQWKEQYGRIAPEAMACGRAVIVSNSGTLPELVGDAALVFEEGNVNQLAKLLELLIVHESDREELGRQATIRAHTFLSATQQVEIMEMLIMQLIGSPSAESKII